MDEQTAIAPNPATAELTKIYTDKNHPDHAGYWAGDEKVLAKVREMYAKGSGTGVPRPISTVVDQEILSRADVSKPSAPSGPVVSLTVDDGRGDITVTSGNDPEELLQRAQERALASVRQDLGDDFQPDIEQDPHAIVAALHHEWGEQFQQNWAGAMNLRAHVIREDPQLAAEAGMLLGDLRICKLLHRFQQVIRDYRG
jgi:hypothetical protein